jgi:hypothetical protein
LIHTLLVVSLGAALLEPAQTLDAAALAREHETRRFANVPAPCLNPDLLATEIDRLATAHPGQIQVETIGTSFHDRKIRLISVGRGPKTILLWSQMHGDEPSATPALLDLTDYLARESARPEIRKILDAFTLRMIPMLNPDGALAYERRNAQGIDVNRDALMLTTPEGVLLKSVRDRFSPILGFNLHDQGRRITVGETGVLSSISLLAVSGDAEGTLTPGRMRAKRVASHIAATLSPFIPGGIARYDEDWNPRAFGDNVTAWGTPVVLIESGGFPKGGGFVELTRLNFVALIKVLEGLAANDLDDVSPNLYDGLLRNKSDGFADVAIVGASILEPRSGKWFRADVAFDALSSDQTTAGCSATPRTSSRVVEVGDSRVVSPARKIDGRQIALASLSRDRGLRAGEIQRTALAALRPDLASPPADPQAFLGALRLSERGLTRGGAATFVLWVGDAARPGGGRFFVVINGVGLPPTLD